VRKLRRAKADLAARQARAALEIQRVYRGHKARVMFHLKMRAHQKKVSITDRQAGRQAGRPADDVIRGGGGGIRAGIGEG
jgi:hypothetical protein